MVAAKSRRSGKASQALRLARGEVLSDRYPTQYLPEVGRQVMADGGVPMSEGDRNAQLNDLVAYADRLDRSARAKEAGEALAQTWPVQLAKSVVSAATAPRDAYVRGMGTEEMVSRAQDMTGLIAGGGFAGTPKGAMGTSGTRIIRPDYSLVRGAVPNEVPSHLYMTERGSVYSNYPDFTSIRYKAARPEHPGEHGLQARSMKTVFMDDAALNRVGGLHQNHEFPGYFMPIPDQKGRAAIYMTEDYGPVRAGTMYPRTEVPYSMIPERGLSPVEIFNPFSPRGIHFGNRIIDME